jgi:Flp pilus assembly protein TadB
MNFESLKDNIKHMKGVVKELYVFTNQIDIISNLETPKDVKISSEEKKLLNDVVSSLTEQLKILNSSVPELINGIGFFKKLESSGSEIVTPKEKLIQIEYVPNETMGKVSLTITEKDKKEFLENLSKSNLSINKLKTKFSVEKSENVNFGKANFYAKLSNHFFRDESNKLVAKKYFDKLNRDLRMMNSPFVVGTYVSVIFLTVLISFLISIIILILLLFFDFSLTFPFLHNIPAGQTIFTRFFNFFWIIFLIPLITGTLVYIYPSGESKSLGNKIDQELPFVVIHMSAIATSGVEPISIFKIILRSDEYKYSNVEFRKLMNLINFHGKDFITALRDTSRTCPSEKMKILLDGLATTVTSGGDLHEYLDKHSETLLFDYKLEREKYTKTSETFMDIYISIVIAAPMIFLLLFVIMGSTGSLMGSFGIGVDTLSILLILGIAFLNVGFLVFLRMKQPVL